MKDQHIDILGVSAFLLISILFSVLFLFSDKEMTSSSYTIWAILWAATLSQACLAYGRRKIEDDHLELYRELKEPYSIFNRFTDEGYRKFLWFVFSLRFFRMDDGRVKMSFAGFLILSIVAVALIFHLQSL